MTLRVVDAACEALSAVADGDDWRWQLRHAARTAEALRRTLDLTEDEYLGALRAERAHFPILVTPYLLDLCDARDPGCPIRRQIVPHVLEGEEVPGDLRDPLGEEAHEVAPQLVRRYPDRALLLVSDRCAVYCRFCTRSRMVGRGGGPRPLGELAPAFAYLAAHPEIREVIVSGGDPLVMATERLEGILQGLRAIPSIEVIRLASRVPSVLPQRITPELVAMLRRYPPLWLMTHFNHPKELTVAARSALRALVDAGIPVNCHTVLLRGVNAEASVLEELFRGLVRERVRPYYLLQADPVRGSGHLRTPLHVGVEIMRVLQGRLSGIALPKLIVDTPGGMGKVPAGPDFVVARGAGVTRFVTHRGVEVDYLDPPGE